MRWTYWAVVAMLCIGGCKGSKGDTGQAGPSGPQGSPGSITTYTGFVISDSQFISIPAYTTGSDISVFVGNGTLFTETPYYLPLAGMNVFYAAQIGSMTLYNALTGAASNYKIVVINPAGSSGLANRLLNR